MLLDMNGSVCEVVTGVVVGEIRLSDFVWNYLPVICSIPYPHSSRVHDQVKLPQRNPRKVVYPKI